MSYFIFLKQGLVTCKPRVACDSLYDFMKSASKINNLFKNRQNVYINET